MFDFHDQVRFYRPSVQTFIQYKNYREGTPYPKDEVFEMYVAEYGENKHKLGIRQLIFS